MLTKHCPLVAMGVTVLLLAGCQARRPDAPAAAPVRQDDSVQGTVVGDDRTSLQAAADAAGAPQLSAGVAAPHAKGAGRVTLAANAPDSYVVKPGDTLWGIAKTFLRDPWFWPELWQANPQIENPHLIYPGDILHLVYIDGEPHVVLQRGDTVHVSPRLRSEPRDQAIKTIPFQTVASFMSKPSVLSAEQIKGAGYLLASRDDHEAIAEGNTVYARGLPGADVGMRYTVVHVGDPLRDPDDGSVVGYNGIYTGSGRVTHAGDPTSLLMTDSAQESEPGDKVLPSNLDVALDFLPSPPRRAVNARIMAVTDGVDVIGQYEVVVINRGARDGLMPGNVLTIYQAGALVADQEKNGFLNSASRAFAEKVRLPDEPTGTFMVFKTYERISYGLVMEAKDLIHLRDRVSSP
jgi:LysM repeat protein